MVVGRLGVHVPGPKGMVQITAAQTSMVGRLFAYSVLGEFPKPLAVLDLRMVKHGVNVNIAALGRSACS